MALKGKKSKTVRELTVKFEAGSLLLRVVDAYKHLGGIVTLSGSQCRELQARIRAMNAGVRPVMANFSCMPR